MLTGWRHGWFSYILCPIFSFATSTVCATDVNFTRGRHYMSVYALVVCMRHCCKFFCCNRSWRRSGWLGPGSGWCRWASPGCTYKHHTITMNSFRRSSSNRCAYRQCVVQFTYKDVWIKHPVVKACTQTHHHGCVRCADQWADSCLAVETTPS